MTKSTWPLSMFVLLWAQPPSKMSTWIALRLVGPSLRGLDFDIDLVMTGHHLALSFCFCLLFDKIIHWLALACSLIKIIERSGNGQARF